jgi:hypothetical protein
MKQINPSLTLNQKILSLLRRKELERDYRQNSQLQLRMHLILKQSNNLSLKIKSKIRISKLRSLIEEEVNIELQITKILKRSMPKFRSRKQNELGKIKNLQGAGGSLM